MIIEKQEELHKATKKRVKKMKDSFKDLPDLKVFHNAEEYDQLIAQIGIEITALCEHHEVAFHGHVSIAYIPEGYLIGLSKLARVAEHFLNPTVKTLQERATQNISNLLWNELKPKGLMVVVKATHDCIKYRGVKKSSETITSSVKGIFLTDVGLRQEFLQLIK